MKHYNSRTATLNFLRWFCSLQLELARPNYMNRKIEIFKRCLVMQKTLLKVMHCKIIFVYYHDNKAASINYHVLYYIKSCF